jgi:hypothetical protein
VADLLAFRASCAKVPISWTEMWFVLAFIKALYLRGNRISFLQKGGRSRLAKFRMVKIDV